MYTEITQCRACASAELSVVSSLGQQYLTGVFPKSKDQQITKGPLDLVWCAGCGLLQLKQSYPAQEMYGDNYGYRSGLNASMVRHLQRKVRSLERLTGITDDDVVLDIGSNDATLLKSYSGDCIKVGIDPTGSKFKGHYTADITLVAEFFSIAAFRKAIPTEKPKIITSIAMVYDLERPLEFVADIAAILKDDGIWHFEQSYMPSMLRTTSYDTVCHEHLEFYSFGVIEGMLKRCGMRVVDVQMNPVNGGSFAVTACKQGAPYVSNLPVINWLLQREHAMGLATVAPYLDFAARTKRHRIELRGLIKSLVRDGKKIIGYGASTKGNVLLQYCGLTAEHISCIAEVNEDKFGSFTPGSLIPIVSEREARAMEPDYFLVLPWHFKQGILDREKEFSMAGGRFIFPLPEIEVA